MRQVLLDLHAEHVARELLLELGGIRRVELDGEAQDRLGERQAHLAVERLVEVEPVPHLLRAGVLEPEVVRLEQVHLLAHLLEQHAAQRLRLSQTYRAPLY